MKKKILEALQDRLEHLFSWQKRINLAKSNIPNVQNMVDQSRLDFQAFSRMPDDGEEFLPPHVLSEYLKGNEFIKTNLPLPPIYDSNSLRITGVVSTTGSTGAYESIVQAGLVNDPDLNNWSREFKHPFYEIQQKQARFDIVVEKLEILNPERAIELEESKNAFLAFKSDIGEKVKAATCMRYLLEHLKGDLYERARRKPKEKMTWGEMASRLASNIPSGVVIDTIIDQEKEWGELHDQLSAVVHKQKSGDFIDLESVWVKLVDHLFIVLGLIKI